MNAMDHIAISGLRAMAKGGTAYLEDLAATLSEDSHSREMSSRKRGVAVLMAMQAAKHLDEAQNEMRKLTNLLDDPEPEHVTTPAPPAP